MRPFQEIFAQYRRCLPTAACLSGCLISDGLLAGNSKTAPLLPDVDLNCPCFVMETPQNPRGLRYRCIDVSKNDEFCVQTRNCALKTRKFVFKMMNFAGQAPHPPPASKRSDVNLVPRFTAL